MAACRCGEAAYDRLVETERAKEPEGKPLRIVVEYEDQSMFVTTNAFKFVIYDETDAAVSYPSSVTGYWPFPGTPSGIMSVDGSEDGHGAARHLVGHYYQWFVD